jgi:hypothetical protein
MQYILTDEEYQALVPAKTLQKHKEALEIARGKLLSATGFTYIHESDSRHEEYCDDCPCSPYDVDYSHCELICTKPKNYSQ